MKNSQESFNQRCEKAEERIGKFEDSSIKMIQSEKQKVQNRGK